MQSKKVADCDGCSVAITDARICAGIDDGL